MQDSLDKKNNKLENGPVCTKCGANKVAKSRTKGADSLIIRFFPRRPYRCLHCYHRFWHTEAFFADTRRVWSWLLVFAVIALFLLLRGQMSGRSAELDDPRSGTTTEATSAINDSVQVSPEDEFKSKITIDLSDVEDSETELSARDKLLAYGDSASINGNLSEVAKRGLIESLDFNPPEAPTEPQPAISKSELERRLAEAKLKSETARKINEQKKLNLADQVKAQPAEVEALLRVDINYRIEQWRKAWEMGDSDHYLTFYSKQFVPPGSLSIQQWRNQRRQRVVPAKKISLVLSNFKVGFGEGNIISTVTFDQKYQAKNFLDNSRKELILSKDADQWMILAEREVSN